MGRFVSVDCPARGKVPARVETYLERDGWYEYASGGRMTWKRPGLRDATPDEVEAWKSRRAEVAKNRANAAEREATLLALCGLSHSDFSRFRGVYREGDILCVETRENGTNTRSVGAIQNPHYLRSSADDFDSTYEHYEFSVPAEALTGETK